MRADDEEDRDEDDDLYCECGRPKEATFRTRRSGKKPGGVIRIPIEACGRCLEIDGAEHGVGAFISELRKLSGIATLAALLLETGQSERNLYRLIAQLERQGRIVRRAYEDAPRLTSENIWRHKIGRQRGQGRKTEGCHEVYYVLRH